MTAEELMRGGNRVQDHQDEHRYDNENSPLFDEAELTDLRSRWQRIQGSFVDEPRVAAQQADALVATTMEHLTQSFASERARLEDLWSKGDSVSTEDLRQALKRYRSYFDRLLKV